MSSQRSWGIIESRLSVNSADPQLGVEQREDNLERDAESKRQRRARALGERQRVGASALLRTAWRVLKRALSGPST